MTLHWAKFHGCVRDLQLPRASACGIADYCGRGNGCAFRGIPYPLIEVEFDDRRAFFVEAEQNGRRGEFIRI